MGVRRQYDKFVSNFLSSNDERPEEAIEGFQIDSDSNESKQLEQLQHGFESKQKNNPSILQ